VELIVATRNPHKLREISQMLQGLPYEVKSLSEVGDFPEVEEDGKTFEENAKKKALDIVQRTGKWVLADDSGLCVEALGGEPGVLSARFAGPEKNDLENNLKLLRLLSGFPPVRRKAYFYCAVAIAKPGQIQLVSGRVDGLIADEMKGTNGFGYDSLFFYPPLNCTFGELESEKKNQLSHRSKALAEAKKILQAWV
jgi:XTP/dITP diphosphohydrolase